MKEFSLVSTVFNELIRIGDTIADIENQTLKPTEILITDAGSTDGTYEELVRWSQWSSIKIVILRRERCNVAQGRNLAIHHASSELIVSTDFGCRFDSKWLETLLAPFQKENVQVVGGAYTVEEETIHSLASKANYVLTNAYQIRLDANFIPSSRSIAYYRSVWESVGGYCEWLTLAADDLVFGKAIKSKGYQITIVTEPNVKWGRHESIKGYAKESYRYGLGDGEARVNQRNTISNAVELLMRYFLFVSLLLWIINIGVEVFPSLYFIFSLLLIPGLRSYLRAIRNWLNLKSPKYHIGVLLYSLFMIETTRLNYLKGYIKGYFFSQPEVVRQAKELGEVLG